MEYTVKKGGHKDLHRIYPMMEFDFPDFDRAPELCLQHAFLDSSAELLLLKDEKGTERGYAVVYKHSLYHYALLAYMGVYPTFRGQGAARRFLELLRERYADRQGLFLEVTDYPGSEHGRQLHDFYASLGWRDVNCDYSTGGVASALMCLPLRGPADPTPAARLILRELYAHVLPEQLIDRFSHFG